MFVNFDKLTSEGSDVMLVKRTMNSFCKWNTRWQLLAAIMVVSLVLQLAYLFQYSSSPEFDVRHGSKYSVWPELVHASPINSTYFSSVCVKDGLYHVTGLEDIITKWKGSRTHICQQYYKKFVNIFTVVNRKATLKLPVPFQEKVLGWLGNKDELYREVFNQDIVHIVNEYTNEYAIFSPLREKRPMVPPDIPEDKYFDDIMKSSSAKCDFCKYKEYTAEDTFGRVESIHAFSASNIFKIDSMHAILALKKHNPLSWNLEEFLDLFSLTHVWLDKAHAHQPKAFYPSLIWDILPKCGASQVHPHLNVVLAKDRYHGEIEAWRKAAQEYYNVHKSNYFSDLISLYSALNLTVMYGTAVAFANLTPKKENEIVVMAKEANRDFYTLLFVVLRALLDDLHKMCYSMGFALPAFEVSAGKMPAHARVITRGYISDIRSDISSFEMFLATAVNIDPFKTIGVVRKSLENNFKNIQT